MPGSVLGDEPPHRREPRDGDGDGRVHDGRRDEHALAATAPAPPPAPPPANLREFGDAAAMREAIYGQALAAAEGLGSVANDRHELAVERPGYEGRSDFSLPDQKRAILEGGTLARRLRADLVLRDRGTGEELDRRRTTLAAIPHVTERGTFIRNGNEYTLGHQLRLRPGVYTRAKENGELEAHVNVLPGQGASSRVFMEPDTGRFRLQMGQAKMPLLPLLRAMGATDSALRGAWGNDLLHANALKDDPQVVDKLHARLVRGTPAESAAGRAEAVKNAFEAMPLDPEVTRETLGHPHARVTLDALLDTTKKLLAVHRGEARPDDRDNLAFMTLHGPEDLLAERLSRGKATLRQALWKASRTRSLKGVGAGLLTRNVDAAILSSGLGQPLEEVNPAQIFEQQGRVSRLGDGGIPSLDSVPDESRSVQPSHFGFIDPLVTPESLKVGVDSRLAVRAKKGPGGQVHSDAFRTPDGKPLALTPAEAAKRTIAFAGELASGRPYVDAQRGGKTVSVPRHEADAEMVHGQHAYAPITNLVPMFSAVKPQRAVMAGRMITQALPVVDPESPHVQSGVPGAEPGQSFERTLGAHMGALRSHGPGVVEAVTPDSITVRDAQGKRTTHALYSNFPFNRKTLYHQTPVVRPGQPVGPGDLLARSNYTDEHGVTALGKNARVAYVPLDGHNFEDAIAVSESFARRMQSEHMYQHELEHADDLRIGKLAHAAIFPGKHDRATLAKFDDDGVIRPGTEVDHDHPLVLAARRREHSHGSIHAGRKGAFTDASLTWGHHARGVVTDVAKTAKGVLVTVKAHAPLEVGDKLSGRYGDKGVISKIVPDAEMPHDRDGRPFEVAMNPLGTISRTNPAQHVEGALGKVAAITGRKYSVVDFDKRAIPDLTAYAQQELAKAGLDPDSTEPVVDPVSGRRIRDPFTGGDPQTANRFVMKLHHTAESKAQGRGTGSYTAEGMPAKGGEMGCFVARQHVQTTEGPVPIGRICEKRLGVQVRTFSEELGEWVYRPVTDWFVFRARVEDVLAVHVVGPCHRHAADSRRVYDKAAIYPTKNHEVLLYDGCRIPAGELRRGDRLVTWGPVPTKHQWAFLYGTLLGDASATRSGFTFEHSVKQRAYIDWKRSVLAGLSPGYFDQDKPYHESASRRFPQFRGKNKKSRVVYVGHPHVFRPLRKACYTGVGKLTKRITDAWLSRLTDLSVAVWLLDDGSISNRAKKRGGVNLTGNIATHGFAERDVEKLVTWLTERYGCACKRTTTNAINLSAEMCRRLIEVVATWVPWEAIPRSKRYLAGRVREIQRQVPPKRIRSVCRFGKVPLPVLRVRPYKHDKPGVDEINVYDFTVKETHTYCAGPALVSNSKRLSLMDLNALLSHGATEVVRDAGAIRGQSQPELWAQVMAGRSPAPPKVPHTLQKFHAQLRAAGIHPVKEGTRTHLMALADRDVDTLAEDRDLRNAETVDWKGGMKPVKGGLFDPALTGGHAGGRWSAIRLHEPLPNPAMEEPIRRVLGLTEARFRAVLAGTEPLGEHGTGPHAIRSALKAVDVDRAIDRARAEAASGRKGLRDQAVRRLGYLKDAKRLGLHPGDWTLSRVPVLPPAFRPVSVMKGTGLPMVADANALYRDLFDADRNVRDVQEAVGAAPEERLAAYDALKAVVGLGDAVNPKTRDRQAQGILRHVFGHSPKFGVVQRKLLGSTVDLVGRAVITPDPDLDMDQVGIPENRAWDVYRPFVVRRMVRRGVPPQRAVREHRDRTGMARQALAEEMAERPVIVTRAPVLHRYGVMAFRPRLARGETVRMPPIVVKGFGADFDGDAVTYHVPASDEAVRDALAKMLPSRNLISAASFRGDMYLPGQEYVGGLFTASRARDDSRRPATFATLGDVARAYARGEIAADAPVNVLRHD